ncbi:two-component system sensor kinase protein [Corynebacterium kutscheri]|uniref:Two-component system sensor kinase protein n=1 Tax=Corynebacterium kutscheri TaxID=35755 RepID=A0A0F6R1Z9_9CORY|nr:DUF2020 domain-containing protein [Corynebacterium kutscheri]AKE42170.1 protein of unknown function (DUF2020) [Corynebacterium kutscheri]VEH05836.1 two-component system sensor kinase protein [Corynebacterium kutscheri]VEH10513.1 two-component system sensor kinase protein [Corynebacterium kutscheri]VEH81729.1 two-component system sensor kinase protein [Corynebacterium kutscheri]
MRRTLPSLLGVSLIVSLLSACSTSPTTTDASGMSEQAAQVSESAALEVHDHNLPVDTFPDTGDRNAWQECPYLDTAWVSDTNGQRTLGQTIDDRFDTPACTFWSYPEEPHVKVLVRHMNTVAEAIAVVDWAAPVNTTEPADQPAGWSGGRIGNEQGAIYAVQKDTIAVVVWSNQQQSLKTQLIAEEVISRLGY